MKISIVLSVLLVPFFVKAQEGDSFEIDFYGKHNYKGKTVGTISGNVAPDSGAGTPRGNITVSSFKTADWLQVTLYTGPYWSGSKKVFVGSQKKISPPFKVRSVKWKHL
jgi:hypothetical protein